MKNLKLLFCLSLACLFISCASVKYSELAKPTSSQDTLSEGYSLLSYLMKDESNLDKILWIKDTNPKISDTIQKISKVSRETQARLQVIAQDKPVINLKTPSLPPIEAKTRDAISKSTTSTLLGTSGNSFELRLLLTQVQATNYAVHLCQVLAAEDPNPSRQKFLNQTKKSFLNLREEAVKEIGAL